MDFQPNGSVLHKWRRLVLRMDARSRWHLSGLHLWLVRHPGLRHLPCPYPAVGNLVQSQKQATMMVENGILPAAALRKALAAKSFNVQNFQDAIQLRNRFGIKMSFLEDPLLDGMMAGKAVAGLASQVKRDAMKEAKAKADLALKKGQAEDEARAMIGPRGGLPSLRQIWCD